MTDIAAASPQALESAFDALNEELEEFEKWLEGRGFRARVSVPLPSGGSLAWAKAGPWAKAGGTMRLLSVSPKGEEQPLTIVSARRQLEAIAAIPALVEACRSGLAERISAARGARHTLRALRGEVLSSAEAELVFGFCGWQGERKA